MLGKEKDPKASLQIEAFFSQATVPSYKVLIGFEKRSPAVGGIQVRVHRGPGAFLSLGAEAGSGAPAAAPGAAPGRPGGAQVPAAAPRAAARQRRTLACPRTLERRLRPFLRDSPPLPPPGPTSCTHSCRGLSATPRTERLDSGRGLFPRPGPGVSETGNGNEPGGGAKNGGGWRLLGNSVSGRK